jgi:hypothetical protein
VSASRGRERVKVFTDDLEFLEGAVTRSAARLSATELMGRTRVAQRDASHGPVALSRRALPALALHCESKTKDDRRVCRAGEEGP